MVTGFLGRNAAGKSTTMRMIFGLDTPTAGSVTVNGRPYAEHPAPLHEAGALLEARSVHTGRSARNHLLALAATTGIGRRRVEEVIDLVGLREVAGRVPHRGMDTRPTHAVGSQSFVRAENVCRAPGRIRTCGTRFRRAVLYPLSYWAVGHG